jgi:hypothetical protein
MGARPVGCRLFGHEPRRPKWFNPARSLTEIDVKTQANSLAGVPALSRRVIAGDLSWFNYLRKLLLAFGTSSPRMIEGVGAVVVGFYFFVNLSAQET